MKTYEQIEKEIEQQKASIKEMEEKLKEAKKELKKFDKYRGLKFDLYRSYRNDKYRDGLGCESFVSALRTLVLNMAGVENHGRYLRFYVKHVSETNPKEMKLCNDFINEIYPIVAKYVDLFLEDKVEVIK